MDIKTVYNNQESLFRAMEKQYNKGGKVIPLKEIDPYAKTAILEKYGKEADYLIPYLKTLYIRVFHTKK